MQIWAESGKSALPICNYSQILYQFLTFTQNLKRSLNIIGYYNEKSYRQNMIFLFAKLTKEIIFVSTIFRLFTL